MKQEISIKTGITRFCRILPELCRYFTAVLYSLPWRLSDRLDERETVKLDRSKQLHCGGYRPEMVEVSCQDLLYNGVRTYVVIDKLPEELAPNDWYFNVVIRGAITCGLSEEYCWKLFQHMYDLQRREGKQVSFANLLSNTHTHDEYSYSKGLLDWPQKN